MLKWPLIVAQLAHQLLCQLIDGIRLFFINVSSNHVPKRFRVYPRYNTYLAYATSATDLKRFVTLE